MNGENRNSADEIADKNNHSTQLPQAGFVPKNAKLIK
jgi:hypothetical protein